jgi:hypothetical protein
MSLKRLRKTRIETYHPLVYANDMNLLGVNIHTSKKNAEPLTDATKETALEVNTKKNHVYIAVSSPKRRAKS